jgi:hypothetical protein
VDAPWKQDLRAVYRNLGDAAGNNPAVERAIGLVWKLITLLPLMVKWEGRSEDELFHKTVLLCHGGCGAARSIAKIEVIELPLLGAEYVTARGRGSNIEGIPRSIVWFDPLGVTLVRA